MPETQDEGRRYNRPSSSPKRCANPSCPYNAERDAIGTPILFHKDSSQPDGLARRCAGCRKAGTKKWQDANRGRVRDANREYQRRLRATKAGRRRLRRYGKNYRARLKGTEAGERAKERIRAWIRANRARFNRAVRDARVRRVNRAQEDRAMRDASREERRRIMADIPPEARR